MKSLLLCIVLSTFGLVGTTNVLNKPCETCEYSGLFIHIKKDKKNSKYIICSYDIDRFWIGIEPDSCSIIASNLFLKGHLYTIPGAPKRIVILAFTKTDQIYYEISDTLATPKPKEEFSFYVKDRNRKFIGVLQNDSTYVLTQAGKYN